MTNIYKWLVAWFDPKSFAAGNSVSLSRRLMALLIVTSSVTLMVDGIKRGISPQWAVAATGLATTLATIWSIGKFKKHNDGDNGQQ